MGYRAANNRRLVRTRPRPLLAGEQRHGLKLGAQGRRHAAALPAGLDLMYGSIDADNVALGSQVYLPFARRETR